MSIPAAWIDRIFEKLTLRYGREFIGRWDSTGIPIEDVKADWAHELAGFERMTEAIAHALANLPPRPPTVHDFREIARKCPPPVFKALPGHKADPERVKAEIAKIRAKFINTKGANHADSTV
jgi:hypothetical protein